ncbi:hypothetical protein ACRAWD_14555 [Caulobacter segnis]
MLDSGAASRAIHALLLDLRAQAPEGVIDLTPGIRLAGPLRQPPAEPRARLLEILVGGRGPARAGWTISRSPRVSSTCRCPGRTRRSTRRSTNTCRPSATTRPGARTTSSSSAGSTGSTASRTSSGSCSTPATW